MNIKRVLTILMLSVLLSIAEQSSFAQSAIEGSWNGTLDVPGAKLHIVFNIVKGAGGSLTATMDSPDQGAKGIPVDAVTFTSGNLHLELKAISGSYDGALKPDNSTIDGNWKQGGMSFPLTLLRGNASSPAPAAPEFKKSSSSDPNDIKGNWLGKLSYSGVDLRLIVHLKLDSTGKFTAAMDSPDQGAMNIPFDESSFQAGHLHLAVKAIGGGLEGDLAEDKETLSAKWTQGGVSLPMDLKRTDTVVTFNRPQEPKPPFPYDSREVAYFNSAGGDTLAGTLTFPKSGGPFPVVLLITGSGPQDRDETLMGHKPFLVLADYLTRRGIAVLRVDDRGVGKSTGKRKGSTSLDFLGDILAGVTYLKTQPEIDPKQIGLIGHSEGGMLAPMAAAKSKDVSFIVMMAGPGVPGDKLLLLQQEMIEKAQGASPEFVERNRKIQEQVMAVAKSSLDSTSAADKIRQIIKDGTANMSDSEKTALEYAADAIEVGVQQVTSPWFRYFLAFDPELTLQKVTCPVLAINGEKDLQVSPTQNLPAIAAALKKGGNKDVTTRELPSLNHLLQTATTGSPDEYVKIEETIAPIALNTIGDWIVAHTKQHK